MITVDFIPQNTAAAATLLRTSLHRDFIEDSLRRGFPDMFCAEGCAIPGPLIISQVERITGPLTATTVACLQTPPKLSIHCRDGHLAIKIPGGDAALGRKLISWLRPVLQAASIMKGQWSEELKEGSGQIGMSLHTNAFRIHRLALPISSREVNDSIEMVESEIGDAIYAAMISHALRSKNPQEAVELLPARQSLWLNAIRGARKDRFVTDDPRVDLGIYTMVEIEASINIQGPIQIGLDADFGSGYIIPEAIYASDFAGVAKDRH